MSMVEPTPATVPADLVALEVEHRAETARVNERRKTNPGACGYRAYRLGKQVANHPWLTAHPAGAERRAARKALRTAANTRESGITKHVDRPARR